MQELRAKGLALAEERASGTAPAVRRRAGAKPKYGEPPLSELEFYGCDIRPMTLAEYEAYEGRIEFFDSRAGIACLVREPMSLVHEDPLGMLGRLVERIALVRGSAIVCRGAPSLRIVDPASGALRAIQPDQTVYLHPESLEEPGPLYWTAGEDSPPDVVVEVDNTTDVRGNRLKLYEAWGFPEVWVEIPDVYMPSRRRGLKPGLRIHLLEEGRYVESEASRAFPGWRAKEIHRGLGERVISERTSAILSRVGRVLGEREGTGPEDDPLLRAQRAEGRAAGRVEGLAAAAGSLLRRRGVSVPADFPAGLTARQFDVLAAASAEEVVLTASAAGSFGDFVARLESGGA